MVILKEDQELVDELVAMGIPVDLSDFNSEEA
jgi:hypothetical protein